MTRTLILPPTEVVRIINEAEIKFPLSQMLNSARHYTGLHDELVEALKGCITYFEYIRENYTLGARTPEEQCARAALAKAGIP